MTTKLYKYQREGVRLIEKFDGRALLADEMGLGKSIQALAYINNHPELRPALVVCPASVKWHWRQEALTHFGMRAEVVEGTRTLKSARTRLFNAPLVIINYDILGPWLKWLEQMRFEIIVADEIHYCKNTTAARTKHVRYLCQRINHVIGLSGTPLTNRPAELWPTLNMIRPDLYGAFTPFAIRYCQPRRNPYGGWEYKGAANLEELNERLNNDLMIRRLKKNVLKDLPPLTNQVIPLDIEDRKQYEYAAVDLIGWLREKYGGKRANKAARVERLTRWGYLKQLVAELKLPSVLRWIDDFLEGTDEKLIVFGIHKAIVKAIHSRYKHSVMVMGEVATKRRQYAVERFTTDKRCRLFVGNIDAAGVGLNLSVASNLAFVELPWTPGQLDQAKSRPHRIGQNNAVSVYYLVGHNTVEEDLCQLLSRKQSNISTVLDGGRVDDFDIFEELERSLLHEQKSRYPKTAQRKGHLYSQRTARRA